MLVGPIDGRVHRNSPIDIPAHVGFGEQHLMYAVPNPVSGVSSMTFPHGLPRPELLRQVPPSNPAPVPVGDAFYDLAVIAERAPALALRTRQQGLNTGPLVICKNLKTRHPPS